MLVYPESRAAPRRCARRTARQVEVRRLDEESKVVVMAEPTLRSRLDIGVEGAFAPVHVDSVTEAVNAIRRYSAAAIFLSSTVLREETRTTIAGLVTSTPGVTPVVLVAERSIDDRLLMFGACGIRHVVDMNEPSAWDKLRSLGSSCGGAATDVRTGVLSLLDEASSDARQFIGLLVHFAPFVRTVRNVAAHLNVNASTLNSRLFRAGLPTAKTYLSHIRLAYAAALFEHHDASLASVALRLDFSSPQAFMRTIRTVYGMTGMQFKTQFCLAGVLDHFGRNLVWPYKQALCRLRLLHH